jgi:hypothetical protein
MATPSGETAKERLAAAQARAAAAADDASEREQQERIEISRAKLAKLLKLDAAARLAALSDGTDDLVPADRRRLVRSLEGQAPPRRPVVSDRKTLFGAFGGRQSGTDSWVDRVMDVWRQPWIFGRDRAPVVAKAAAPRRTGKTTQISARTGPGAAASSPARRPHNRSPEHTRPVGAGAHPPHAVDAAEPAAAIQGSPDRSSDPDPDPGSAATYPVIRRGASPETIRRLRSAAEVNRLKALPTAELAGAVATEAMADLTDDDKRQVMDLLIAHGHTPHVDAFAPGARPLRKPVAMTGNGLPCRPGVPPRNPRIPVWIVGALAVVVWVVVVWQGYGHIDSSTFGSP